MKHRAWLALPALALLLLPSAPGLRAEDAPAGQKEQKVRRLLELTGAAAVGKQAMEQMIAGFQPMEAAGQLPPGFCKKFSDMTDPKEIAELAVPAYVKHLSEEDLDGAIAFYQTPAGRHMAEALPAITRESMEAGQKWGQAMVQKVMAALQNGGGGGLTPDESPVR